MIYRELQGRKAGRCDICGATDGTVSECYWPYSKEAEERFDRYQSTGAGQYYDACHDCRSLAGGTRQKYTDERGVRKILRKRAVARQDGGRSAVEGQGVSTEGGR